MPKSKRGATKRSGRKQQQRHSIPESASRWLARRWRVVAGSAIALVLAVGAYVVIDPNATPTALDANGERVEVGPIDTPGGEPRVGSPAPNFVLADYDGNAVRLEDFRGKVVFLNFWATWCTACEAEMPAMNRLAKNHRDDLVVIAVNRGEGSGKAKRWSDDRDLDALLFLVDSKETISGVYRLPNSMPVSFYIDADGVVSRVTPSAQDLPTMELYYEEAILRTSAGRVAE